MLSNGEVFAGYRIMRLLGAGGMGEVYLAQHPRLSRQDAIKVLPAELTADQDFAERFRREADLTASLWHPAIVGVHDCGEFNGRLWISMDFVDGSDAARLLANEPDGLPVTDVVEIVGQIADALDFAHQRGLLHRDVKPANILIADGDGPRRILLADFGVGREINHSNGLTATNMTLGTVAYAAPEQLMGEVIDGRADQYALAATAYHLLAGRPVFDHSNPAVVISRHLNLAPPALDRHPQLSALDSVLQRALAKAPNHRFSSCAEFAAALRAEAKPIPSVSTGSPIRTSTQAVDNLPASSTAPTQLAPVPEQLVDAAVDDTAPTRPRIGSRLVIAGIAAVTVAAAGTIAAIVLLPREAETHHAENAPDTPDSPSITVPASAAEPTAVPPPVPPPTTSAPVEQTRLPPQTRPVAAGIALPSSYGSTFVITRSGKTACQIRVEDVGCQVQWTVPTPLRYGAPANGVRVRANGDWEWATGDMGNQNLITLAYGESYRTLGWTIDSTSAGTTFTNDATGRGMHVKVQGVTPF